MKTMKQEWIEFWKKMARMLDSGIPILATFETIQKEATQPAIRETCQVLLEEVKAGNTVYDALVRLPQYFSASMLKVIQVGEMTGKLPESMHSLAAGIEEGSFQVVALDENAGDIPPAEIREQPVAEYDLPIINIAGQICKAAYQQKASAIHIEVRADGIKIRFRVDGVLREVESPPKGLGPTLVSRFKIMANMNVSEKRLPQDGRIQLRIANQPVDLRVSYMPLIDGESLVLRLLTAPVYLPEVSRIFRADHLATLQRWLKRPSGLIVVNGPMGSGKTTTLYSILKSFDPIHNKIMTVEQPVEYQLEGVCQQGINPSLGLTYPAALRATFRHDPDVVMLGEVRDRETVAIMTEMALMGTRVLTVLHADGGVQAAQRLVDIGVESHLLASVLVGVISQRLVRQICPHCKEEIKTEPWMREFFPKGGLPKLQAGKGCEKCNGTGYSGRLAIFELFEPTGGILRKLTMDGSTLAEVQAEAEKAGLKTLRQEGLALVAEGVTTLDEILRVIPKDA
jgi:type II secretory ATPase GspE/PulE/Tfp pilus assembly ATPase PilB-like protein